MQAITPLGNRKIYGTLKFCHWIHRETWNISKKSDRRAQGRKFGTRGTSVRIWMLLLMPDSLSLVWRHSVHFAKFPILQFLQFCSSPNFHPFHPNFIQGVLIIQAITFWRSVTN